MEHTLVYYPFYFFKGEIDVSEQETETFKSIDYKYTHLHVYFKKEKGKQNSLAQVEVFESVTLCIH